MHPRRRGWFQTEHGETRRAIRAQWARRAIRAHRLAKADSARYGQHVTSPWRTLLLVALTAFVLDQWTKLLAVKHLTPGFAVARLARDTGERPEVAPPLEDQEDIVRRMSPLEDLLAFSVSSRAPCSSRGARCPSVRVFDGFWSFRYTENPGAAWSVFSTLDQRLRVPLLVGVSLASLVMILLYARSLGEGQDLSRVALAMIAGGALGNMVDRLRLGYVIDFIDWYAGSRHWPTFNVADAAISVGVGLLGLAKLLEGRSRARAPADVETNDGLAGPMP